MIEMQPQLSAIYSIISLFKYWIKQNFHDSWIKGSGYSFLAVSCYTLTMLAGKSND